MDKWTIFFNFIATSDSAPIANRMEAMPISQRVADKTEGFKRWIYKKFKHKLRLCYWKNWLNNFLIVFSVNRNTAVALNVKKTDRIDMYGLYWVKLRGFCVWPGIVEQILDKNRFVVHFFGDYSRSTVHHNAFLYNFPADLLFSAQMSQLI